MRDLMYKEHSMVRKVMRQFNRSFAKDEYLGKDRFYLKMVSEQWDKFADNSGGELLIVMGIYDRVTGNKAWFLTDNFSFRRDIAMYSNDFMIRCSRGLEGHTPQLSYIAYDIHKIVSYNLEKESFESDVIDTYSLLRRKFE